MTKASNGEKVIFGKKKYMHIILINK